MGTKLTCVVAVRHGEHTAGMLNQRGRSESQWLAEKLKIIFANKNMLVLSSPKQRAVETADILAQTLGCSMRVQEFLNIKDYIQGKKAADNIMAEGMGVEVVIAVTHSEAPSGIISGLLQVGFDRISPKFECNCGNGLSIDLTNGEVVTNLLSGDRLPLPFKI